VRYVLIAPGDSLGHRRELGLARTYDLAALSFRVIFALTTRQSPPREVLGDHVGDVGGNPLGVVGGSC